MMAALRLILFGAQAPAIPTGLAATGGTGSIVWTWTAVAGATTYDLQYSSDGGSTYSTLTTGVATNTYTDSSAASHCNASGVSFVKVRATNSGGSSAYSSGVSGTEYNTAWGITDWWNLEDTAAAIGSDTLTNNNSVTFTAGKIGSAATLASASSQYLSVASNSGLQTGNLDFWVACWIKTSSTTARGIVCKSKFVSVGEYILYQQSNITTSDPFFQTFNGSGTNKGSVSLGTAIADGAWHFLMAYQDVTNSKLGISMDGGAFTLANTTGPAVVNTEPVCIGAFTDPGHYANGQIDSAVFGKSPPGGIAAIATAIRDKLYNSGSGRSAPFNG